MNTVSQQTLHWIENEEGCRLKAYQDSRGIWTIGVGMTKLYGHPVKPGDTISQQEADRLFGVLVAAFQSRVLQLVKVPLTENQITALVSFAYNEGLNAFACSTLLKKLNAKDYHGAADEFLKWERAGNDPDVLKGRRERERSLFLK